MRELRNISYAATNISSASRTTRPQYTERKTVEQNRADLEAWLIARRGKNAKLDYAVPEKEANK